eukprot:CAMPEP_0180558356 /NCGR_PEP_ID=MMETSP1037_2-20121125/1688_1 /TAXON_ID=632150 /ORGANISM="Azadinium spinosum, Strain 3D9" /LENGTH=544 /DNA_ID=CAMNT_0022574693 /DNA_START=1 /DNA_END=1635 /DNA_ORIENTATION=+
MNFLEEWKREHERKETARKLALSALKANPLRFEAWMTARDKCDWMPFFCNAGAAGCMSCWGVREALRFGVASKRCRYWRAVRFLSRRCRSLEAVESQETGVPSAKELVAAHEKIMQFCVQASTFEMRLDLEGIDGERLEEYKTHTALRFIVGHTCLCGAVAHVQLGYWGYDHDPDDDWADADWSEAPGDFLSQFETKAVSVRATARYKDATYTIAEAFAATDSRGIDLDAINALSPLMQIHNCGERRACCDCEVIFHVELHIPTATFSHFVGLGQHRSYPTLALGSVPLPTNIASSPLHLVGVLWSSQGIDLYPDRKDDFDMARDHYGPFSFPFNGTLALQPVPSSSADVPVRDRVRLALAHMLGLLGETDGMGAMVGATLQNIDHLTEVGRFMTIPREMEADTINVLASLLEMGSRDGNALRGMSLVDALAAVADMADLDFLSYDASISPIDRSDWEWMEETYKVDRASLLALDSFGRTRFQLHGLEMHGPYAGRRLEHEDARHASGMNGKVSVRFTSSHLRLTFLDTSIAELVMGGQISPAS